MPKFKPRTKQQNKVFHSLLSQHKFDAEAKAELVFDITKGRTESSAEMSYLEMNHAIKRLNGTPLTVDRKTQLAKKSAGVVTLATATHLDHLKKLWRENPDRTEAGLEALCLRTIKSKRPRTSKECSTMCEAVKSMNKRYLAEQKEAA